MGRHPSKRTLMLFYDGELGPATADDVGAHASRCGRCRAWMADLASVGAVVRGEIIPTLAPSGATRRRAGTWEPRPLLERLLPALAAVAAIATVLTLVVANDPADQDVAVGADGVVET
ncbi:MAG TPA: zf-HC2 domain-containing protein, partial [Acidimicrobiia bacterium]|nr:zf-HC2 domain-containing protein [Acidimicrobiia bacterium]